MNYYKNYNDYRWYEEQQNHLECEAWVNWAKDKGFSIFGTYTFAGPVSKITAIRKFNKFHQKRAQFLREHSFIFNGLGKQNERRWSDGLIHKGWHFHTGEKYERSNSEAILKKALKWGHGNNIILPFDGDQGGLAYTAMHKSGAGVYLICCPRQSRCCRRGQCYWKEQLSDEGILRRS